MEQELKEYISKYWSYNINKITLNKTLDDLGMFGDDKYEFLIDFAKHFKVDISNMNFNDYIDDEGFNPFLLISELINKLTKHNNERSKLKQITIQQLLNAMEKGKWEE